MDVFLYQLNISGLTISTIVIAMFFVVLSQLIRRAEMRSWMYGWLANVTALSVTGAFWYAQPDVDAHGWWFAGYMVPKCLYALLLFTGALEFASARPRWIRPGVVIPAILVIGATSVLVLSTRDRLGFATSIVLTLAFAGGAAVLARARSAAATWVVVGFGLRAVHAALEGAAYGVNLASTELASDAAFAVPANLLLAAHYSLGIGAEWLLAMGCIIGVSARIQHDLVVVNSQLMAAQDGLRRLAHHDPLTALANRRALPTLLQDAHPDGALLIFFDLDGFKQINDERGHHAGDECLVRFATALTQSFRSTDAVVRYAGDEFLVVASGLTEAAVNDRIEAVRARLASDDLPIRFSCGIAHLPRGGNPDDAIRAADAAMYHVKTARGSLALSS